ncbi:MAG: ElyC/SanA/YdcF family protein [Bacilli bacterium]
MLKKLIFLSTVALLTLIIIVIGINVTIITSTRKKIVDPSSLKDAKKDAIVVLGASVYANKTPSPMLEDRILKGIELYKTNASSKLLMSGDHKSKYYDEVNVMKNYAKELEVPSNDIFMDHYGVDTYESLYRAKHIFKANKIIIVTQEYHLYRALYIADKLGLDVVGVKAKEKSYKGQINREFREILARVKAYFNTNIKAESKHKGQTIPITGNGDITNN